MARGVRRRPSATGVVLVLGAKPLSGASLARARALAAAPVSGRLWLSRHRSAGGGGAGDGDQICGQHAQPDPALQAIGAVVRAALQAVDPLEHPDSPLDPCSPAIAPPEPARRPV